MGLFIFFPNSSANVLSFQHQAQTSLSIAWQQTIGDQPYFAEVGDVIDGVASFYDQATNATIAMLSMPEADQDLAAVFSKTYQLLAHSLDKPNTAVALNENMVNPADFMTQEPVFNIILDKTQNVSAKPEVSGEEITVFHNSSEVVNLENPWFTAMDAMTGQKYCMAIYNGEVNKYLGECKNDYH
ncbi:MAG TPA: hypothetical protein VL306_02130 [Methylomirabilota bacterium]|nr:hypothetical protein [Methylomirabilota bacterium]